MFTPQQIEQISFRETPFNGYNKHDVDKFLEPLTDDYIELYKENALLKSKMRVLVAKLEEYRQSEASLKDAVAEAQKTCDTMIKETESKCAQMLSEANQAAAENAKNAAAIIAAENARVEEAKRDAAARIDEMEKQFRACIDALEYIKHANRPKEPERVAFDQDADKNGTDAVADEISRNLESMMGTTDEPVRKAEPKHPHADSTRKIDGRKFGPGYDPTK